MISIPQSRRSDLIICARQVHADKMRQALTMDVLATDLADYLVRKGVSPSDYDTCPLTDRVRYTPHRSPSAKRTTSPDAPSHWPRRGAAS